MKPGARHLLPWALLAIAAGCGSFKKERDFVEDVAAEVTTPIHARLIAYEYDVKPECTETGFMRIRCFMQSEQQGCGYLELVNPGEPGQPELPPIPQGVESAGEFHCSWGERTTRQRVSATALPSRGVELVADPTGTRLAWRAAPTDAWSVYYVLDGEFLEDGAMAGSGLAPPDEAAHPAPPPSPGQAIKWSTIPTLGQRASELLPNASGPRIAKLLKLVRTERGENGVAAALAGAIHLRSDAAWKSAWSGLSPSARDAFHQRVRELIEEDAPEELLNAIHNLPELRPPDYADLLVRLEREAVEVGLDTGEGPYGRRLWLDALVALGDARSGPLACQWLELAVSGQLLAGEMYESWEYGFTSYDSALVAIARHKTPCPWVRVAIERYPCALSYRCTASGLVETSPEAQDEYDKTVQDALDRGVPEPPAEPQHPLCTAAQVQRLVSAWTPGWAYPEIEDEQPETETDLYPSRGDSLVDSPGVLLLAAAYAQGPLPPDVDVRNRRRLYRVVDKTLGTDDVGTCFQNAMNPAPAEVACTVPANLSRIRPAGCTLEIDDSKKLVTLTPPKSPPDGAPNPRLERLRHSD